MSQKVSKERFLAWKYMELAGIFHGKKRRLLLEELSRRTNDNTADADYIEIILMDAQRMYPENRRMRRRHTRTRLKEWEKRASYHEPPPPARGFFY